MLMRNNARSHAAGTDLFPADNKRYLYGLGSLLLQLLFKLRPFRGSWRVGEDGFIFWHCHVKVEIAHSKLLSM